MLTTYDIIVIVFYLTFMFSIGIIFRSYSKNASDFFRGGGGMLWWMVGASAFMQQFSAWTFTGAASKAYQDGTIVAVIFFGNVFGYLINYLWTSYRFRQLRVITPMQAVRERFGPVNEQVFTWLQVPISILTAGIWLNALAVFTAAVFNISEANMIMLVGGVVLFLTTTGGSWAVVASDFIQMLLLMIVSLLMAFLTLTHPAIGGLTGLADKLPSHHFNWTAIARPEIVYFWITATFLQKFFSLNNMLESSRYLCVKDGANARKAALLAGFLMTFGPLIWFIPPMATAIIAPDLKAAFPKLGNPSDAAYVYMGMTVLPTGMLGLLMCGIFAATMSSMDGGLNRNAGIFVKNFYNIVIAPKASERHLVLVGRLVTMVFGLLIILAALYLSQMQQVQLFDKMLLLASLVALPYIIPLVLGLIFKRTPGWAGWSTVLVGVLVSLNIKYVVQPEWFASLFHFKTEMTQREKNDFLYFTGIFGNVLICTLWFYATSWFYRFSSRSYQEQVKRFFTKMNTPIDPAGEGTPDRDRVQSSALGTLSYVYGAFITLLAVLVPNSMRGRLCFVFCGGCLILVGFALNRVAKRRARTS